MPEYHKPEFGEAVRRVLQEHGLTLRAQRIRTGIDHTTMKSMCDGLPGRLEKIEQFARAFNLDVNEWRKLAGFDPVDATNPDAAADQLLDALDQADLPELTYEPDFSDIRVDGFEGVEGIEAGDVEILNEVVRTVAARIAKRRQQGKG